MKLFCHPIQRFLYPSILFANLFSFKILFESNQDFLQTVLNYMLKFSKA